MLLTHVNSGGRYLSLEHRRAGPHRVEHTAETLVDDEAAVGWVCENWASLAGLLLPGRAELLGRLQIADSELLV